ncbi:MAG: hypothetical protein LAP87_31290 [Acidobacteriia bacterium]|nr:hypothetical protein [Terriglobia bacterium]MBZ5729448.1 hypothetical protein [Terriglobia bacterium]
MKTQIVLTVMLVSAAAYAADANTGQPVDTAAAFSRLKSLVGEWQSDSDQGKARLTYELIAGGTALVERERAENRPEMLTVYHLDQGRLLLTHYCMAGNQPRMQASAFQPATGELKFQFLDATNLPSQAAGHMHNVTLRFVDDQHLIAEWQFYENGQVKMTEAAQYARVR